MKCLICKRCEVADSAAIVTLNQDAIILVVKDATNVAPVEPV